MENFLKKLAYLSALVLMVSTITGCSSLAKMKTVNKVDQVNDKEALVNFVRPRIFLGDGVDFEVWDGDKFIGTLAAGSMIQYLTLPGEHDFMIDPTQGGAWAYKNIVVEAGEKYYLKPNTVPFVGLKLGIAESTDIRIDKWEKGLDPIGIDTIKSKPVPQKNIDEARAFVKRNKRTTN